MPRKTKFDAKKYIDANYVENEDAIISVYINKVDDYYNEFDADDLTLSDDILNFIDDRVAHISSEYKVVLEFDSPKITDTEKEKLLSIIKSHYGLEYALNNNIITSNNKRALIFFLLGVVFLLLSYIVNFSNLISDILSIAGWVAIWETVSVLFFDSFESRTNKSNINRLYNAEIVFKERKE